MALYQRGRVWYADYTLMESSPRKHWDGKQTRGARNYWLFACQKFNEGFSSAGKHHVAGVR